MERFEFISNNGKIRTSFETLHISLMASIWNSSDRVAVYKNKKLTIDISNTGSLQSYTSYSTDEPGVHGTSVKNLHRRMKLMFADNYNFRLVETNGMVHAELTIDYSASILQKAHLQHKLPVNLNDI